MSYAIKCGHCKGTHANVQEIKDCYGFENVIADLRRRVLEGNNLRGKAQRDAVYAADNLLQSLQEQLTLSLKYGRLVKS